MENLSELEKIIGYEFKNKHLLQQAVTHSSHTARLSENYERLEFLGDRVLGVSIASLLYRMFPNERRAVCRSGIPVWSARRRWRKWL